MSIQRRISYNLIKIFWEFKKQKFRNDKRKTKTIFCYVIWMWRNFFKVLCVWTYWFFFSSGWNINSWQNILLNVDKENSKCHIKQRVNCFDWLSATSLFDNLFLLLRAYLYRSQSIWRNKILSTFKYDR